MLTRTLATGLLSASLATAQLRYADNQATLIKDGDVASRNFPSLNGTKLYSPAFLDPDSVPAGFKNGTSGPTDDATLSYFLQSLAKRNDWMTYHNPPFSSEEGRPLPYVYLSTSSQPQANSSSPEKVRVWLQGGVHGNEPAGDQALLALLGKMDANATWAASLLEKLDIIVLPRFNPDGVAYFQRFLATGFDPNRDHVKLASQQTRSVKELITSFAPHIGVDSHEYSANRAYGEDDQWVQAIDGQFSTMKNLNIHKDIRELGEGTFVPRVVAEMESQGLRWSPYVTGVLKKEPVVLTELDTQARAGDVSLALNQALVFLTETRGIMLGDQHFQRRVATGLIMIEGVLQTAADNAEQVLEIIEDARKDYAESDEDIVISDSPQPGNTTWQFIELETGELVDVPVQFFNYTEAKANVTRSRPEAYVFSRAWKEAADRLRIAGVEVQELKSDFRGEVEAFNITSATLAQTLYQGTALTTVTAEVIEKEVTLPAGSYWVSAKQRNAAHAFITLEPEGIDSYATFNIVPVSQGDEYPIYRVVS